MSAYRDESTVRVSWVLEGAELERAYRADVQAWVHATRLAVAATVAAAGLVYALTLGPKTALFAFVAMSLVSLWVARTITRRGRMEESYGASWDDRRHVELEATEDTLRLADRVSEERVAWELVPSWHEDEEHIVVFTAPDHRRVIPKRALSAEQRTTLLQLLSDRVRPGGDGAVRAARANQHAPTVLSAVALSLLVGSVIEAFARLF